VWDIVSGHAGELFDLHRDLRGGLTLDQAIDVKTQDTNILLTSIIEALYC